MHSAPWSKTRRGLNSRMRSRNFFIGSLNTLLRHFTQLKYILGYELPLEFLHKSTVPKPGWLVQPFRFQERCNLIYMEQIQPRIRDNRDKIPLVKRKGVICHASGIYTNSGAYLIPMTCMILKIELKLTLEELPVICMKAHKGMI